MQNKKILITGGLGFIGSTLTKKLLEENEIVVLDNLARPNPFCEKILPSHKNLTILNVDVAEEKIQDRIPDEDFDYIVHAAAIAGIYSVGKKTSTTLRCNTLGTINMLDFALTQKNLSRFVDFSTSEIFGDQKEIVTEKSLAKIGPLGQDRWSYAASKLIGEYFSLAYFKDFGLKTTTIRPANVYGGGQIGEGALSNFVIKALTNSPMLIHGSGQQIRSWCHVDDFVDGIVLCLTRDEAIGESFNIGNDSQICTIIELAEKVKKVLSSFSEITQTDALKEDIQDRRVSSQKARNLLGYDPKIDLQEGIVKTASGYLEIAGMLHYLHNKGS